MDTIKANFLKLRTKEIKQRRKNLTCMKYCVSSNLVIAGAVDVMANVLDDPFKALDRDEK